ncbi:Golgi transport complex subunit 5-domain-containing protein [Phialemonium atrogriseum]|uniref:Conserved oligomeric Golgi complex subunit 5 n=1 Tax=Phialemonium atrogriseum TaxID=1093897 RepID=A0AAJ0FKS0_9PEZI|nr:Golgi transport complex subunit 5-domain-containing protein [Phialemonium atrogriseum]KAK1766648.1 Golgi transport complex subunit 5-domain-containing protein [Phialemonium atrogriseum]
MSTPKEDDEPSYIDYETFLSPDFSASSFANTLVLSTNNPNDAPLDLSTPLSRVLFDIQEIDSHIDLLTTRSAVPLLTHTKEQTDSSTRIVGELDGQIKALNDSYKQLEGEVIQKHAEAEQVRQVASRLWETLRLGRAVGRCLQLGRQLEIQHAELIGSPSALSSTSATPSGVPRRVNHRALVRCADTLLSLREMLSNATVPGAEGFGLDRIAAVRTLQSGYVEPTERSVREGAERIVREFSIGTASGAAATFSQADETRARTVSALHALYMLSPAGPNPAAGKSEPRTRWSPTLMLHALELYLRTALQSSIASLARALAALPALDRALAEVAARCQNVVALEAVLEGARPPAHLLLPDKGDNNLLQPLLAYLETGSLASYFWRTLAGSLAPRVQEIVGRGGASARALRANKSGIGEAIRECVARGSHLPSSVAVGAKGKGRIGDGAADKAGAWDREVAVMVGSVVGNLGR